MLYEVITIKSKSIIPGITYFEFIFSPVSISNKRPVQEDLGCVFIVSQTEGKLRISGKTAELLEVGDEDYVGVVKEVLNEDTTSEELGGAEVHATQSGVADMIV